MKNLKGLTIVIVNFDDGQQYYVGGYSATSKEAVRHAEDDIKSMFSHLLDDVPLKTMPYTLSVVSSYESTIPFLLEVVETLRKSQHLIHEGKIRNILHSLRANVEL